MHAEEDPQIHKLVSLQAESQKVPPFVIHSKLSFHILKIGY